MIESDAEHPRLSWSEVAARVALFVALAVLGVLVAAMLPVEGAVRSSVLVDVLRRAARERDSGADLRTGAHRGFRVGLGRPGQAGLC